MPGKLELLAYAVTLELKRATPLPVENWQKTVKNFFDQAGRKFQKKEGALIGHLKGFLSFNGEGYVYFSNVGTKQGTDSRGETAGDGLEGKLDLNVLVYGWQKDEADIEIGKLSEQLAHELEATCVIKELKNNNPK
ncbi:MAG: hypothetical protein PHT78_05820 [Desulfitobacteriaceae bacterium]|nr:hypothetical protein [Desulfitobacteriaceae bacterium]